VRATRALVAASVENLLAGSNSLTALPRGIQEELLANTVQVGVYLAENESRSASPVDFPAFVADLVKGTFKAIVDASVRQMEAYSELISEVAESLNSFSRDKHEPCRQDAKDGVCNHLDSSTVRRDIQRVLRTTAGAE
jgi:hypothetical protein